MTKLYRTLCLLASFIMLFGVGSIHAQYDESIVIDNVKYTYDYWYATAEPADPDVTSLTIPSQIKIGTSTRTVRTIKVEIGEVFPNLKTITLPNTITSVEIPEMYNLPALESFRMDEPNKECHVEDGILYAERWSTISMYIPCQYSKPVTIPEGVTGITLWQMPLLSEISIPATLSNLSIKDCPKLDKITIAEENKWYKNLNSVITYTDEYTSEISIAFICNNVENLIIPEGIQDVELFYIFPNLKSITFPSTFRNVFCAFIDITLPLLSEIHVSDKNKNCFVIDNVLYRRADSSDEISVELIPTMMENVNITENVQYLNVYDLPYLTSIAIPNTTKEVEIGYLPSLSTFVPGDSVTRLEIRHMPNLKELYIPKKLDAIGIIDSYNIENFIIAEGNQTYRYENGCLLYHDIIDYITPSVTTFHIKSRSDIGVPLYEWPHIKNIIMDEIDGYVLVNNCVYEHLSDTNIFNLINSAGGLTSISIYPNGMVDDTGIYLMKKMPLLDSIKVEPENINNLMVIDNILCNKIYDGKSDSQPYVIKAIFSPFKSSSHFAPFINHFIDPCDGNFKGYEIAEAFFSYNDSIRYADLSKIKKIDSHAFYDCHNLKFVKFADGAEIEYAAFCFCDNLGDILFPNRLNLRDAGAFDGTLWAENAAKEDIVYAGSTLYKASPYYLSDPFGEDLILKEGTEYIANGARLSHEIKNLTFPSSFIKSYLYFEGPQWKSFTINSDKMVYTRHLFSECTDLDSVVVNLNYPPEIHVSYVFPNDLSNVKLIVPADYEVKNELTGEMEVISPAKLYSEAYEWNRFGTISGTSGIDSPFADLDENQIAITGSASEITVTGAKAWHIYNLAGGCVASGSGDGSVSLSPGLYVVRADKKVKKIMLR